MKKFIIILFLQTLTQWGSSSAAHYCLWAGLNELRVLWIASNFFETKDGLVMLKGFVIESEDY